MIVVGHSNCGGALACVKAARDPPQQTDSPLYRWLAPLADFARSLGLGSLEEAEALPVLVEENVRQQVRYLAEIKTIQGALERGAVQIHGWVYDLSSGKLNDLEIS